MISSCISSLPLRAQLLQADDTWHCLQCDTSTDKILGALGECLKGASWGVIPSLLEDCLNEITSRHLPAVLRLAKDFDETEHANEMAALVHVAQVLLP